MSDPSIPEIAGAMIAGFAGMFGLAKLLDRRVDRLQDVQEDPDNLGYFLGDPPNFSESRSLLRSLPKCPDYIPEWMMEEHRGS